MNEPIPFETLDPENRDEMRGLAHRMVDDMLDYIETSRDRPVWTKVPERVAETFRSAAPRNPSDPSSVGPG